MAPSETAGKPTTNPGSLPLLTRLIATGFFTGYSPWASGTVGTLVGVLLYLIPGIESLPVFLAVIAVTLVAGVITAGTVAAVEGNRLTATAELAKATFQPGGKHGADPSIVVIDEIVGVWIGLIGMPKTPAALLTSFILFRVFDVVKPQPARAIERLPGGWGIMMDDVIAGLYTLATAHLLWTLFRFLFPHLG